MPNRTDTDGLPIQEVRDTLLAAATRLETFVDQLLAEVARMREVAEKLPADGADHDG